MPEAADLPDDVEALKVELVAARALVIEQKIQLEKLRFEIARLKRMKYGRSSEQLDTQIGQMQLTLEDLEATLAETPEPLRPAPKQAPIKPVRRALPAHLPREDVVHDSACTCPACGGTLRRLGEDVSEMLEYVPGRYKVVRHVRPKFSCGACQKIVQASAPSRPIARGLAGPGFLAHVLVSKYADHLPLYRQSQIYAREGLDLDRSTLADWVGGASELLEPLVRSLGRYVMSATKLHGDDTPVPVLCPGRGTTKQGRLWTYVRDDRPAASTEPPAVLFRYSPDRKGERPKAHLTRFTGVLQADAYAGFERLYGERIQEAACWAHVRRKFYDIHVAHASPIAAEALDRIGRLYGIEAEIRGRPPDERAEVRQARAGPELEALHAWLHTIVAKLSKKSELAL
ncbi:MAG: IS66 family transposase, partial [Bacillati bacterium ANGP1]